MRKKWIDSYKLLLDYYNTHGNVDVPTNYVVDGIDLHIWIANQVQAYRNTSKTKLDDTQIELLNNLGVFERKRRNWDQMYKLFVDYYNTHGSLDNIEDLELKSIARDQRVLYSCGKLSPERIKQLEELKFPFSIREKTWMENYNALKKYYSEYGNINIKYETTYEGANIGYWLYREEISYDRYIKDTDLHYRIKLLEDLGIKWKTRSKWDIQYDILKEYYKKHGNCRVPRDYVVDGYDIFFWCVTQRRKLSTKENLTDQEKERVNRLDCIKFDWFPRDRKVLSRQIDEFNIDEFDLALLRRFKLILESLDNVEIKNTKTQDNIVKNITKRLYK